LQSKVIVGYCKITLLHKLLGLNIFFSVWFRGKKTQYFLYIFCYQHDGVIGLTEYRHINGGSGRIVTKKKNRIHRKEYESSCRYKK